MRAILLILTISSLLSCAEKKEAFPSEVIGPDTMKKVMTDLHLAQSAIAVNAIADSTAFTMSDYQNYILTKYGIQKDRFINSVRYYTAHPDLMKVVYDSVLIDLTRIQAGTN